MGGTSFELLPTNTIPDVRLVFSFSHRNYW